MALAGEVGELVAELQWPTDGQIAEGMESGGLRDRLEEEATDVLIYLLRFVDVCGFDLLDAAEQKGTRRAGAAASTAGREGHRFASPRLCGQ